MCCTTVTHNVTLHFHRKSTVNSLINTYSLDDKPYNFQLRFLEKNIGVSIFVLKPSFLLKSLLIDFSRKVVSHFS